MGRGKTATTPTYFDKLWKKMAKKLKVSKVSPFISEFCSCTRDTKLFIDPNQHVFYDYHQNISLPHFLNNLLNLGDSKKVDQKDK